MRQRNKIGGSREGEGLRAASEESLHGGIEERHMDMQDVPRMSPEELYTRLAQGEAVVVLDVRTTDGLSVHPDQNPGDQVAAPGRGGPTGRYAAPPEDDCDLLHLTQ